MTVIKKFDTGTSEWETIVVGKQGPIGPAGVVASETPPEDTDVVWIDTSETGAGISATDVGAIGTAVGLYVEDYTTAPTVRPVAAAVYWRGTAAPGTAVAQPGDLWFDTTGDAP